MVEKARDGFFDGLNNSPLKTGYVRHMDVPPNSAGSERAKEFVRLAETSFWPTVVEKAKDGFFDGLIRRPLPSSRSNTSKEKST